MADVILMDEGIFNNAISETHRLWGEFNDGTVALDTKHKSAMDSGYWEHAEIDTYEECLTSMMLMLNNCSQNMAYLTSILKQIKFDLERADAGGSDGGSGSGGGSGSSGSR